MKKLKPEIVEYLSEKLNLRPATVKKDIYLLTRNYPKLTKNAIAQIYAQKNRVTIFRKLDKEDRASLPSNEVVPEKIKVKQKKQKAAKRIKILINYDTNDYFKKGHIDELNKAYTYGCYTGTFILARKIVENLIIDILREKYPENIKENKELYFDIYSKRFKDFAVIIENLRNKKNDFGSDNKAVERLCNLAKRLKDDTNDKTHSWFHLVENSSEINNLETKAIIELIKKLEEAVGLRKQSY